MRPLLLGLLLLAAPAVTAGANVTLGVPPFPQRMADRYTSRDGLPPGRILRLGLEGEQPRAETEGAAAAFRGGKWSPVPVPERKPLGVPGNRSEVGTVLDWSRETNGRYWVVTDKGVKRQEKADGPLVPFTPPKSYLTRQQPVNVDADFTSVAVDDNGTVWLGSSAGIYATDGDKFWAGFDRTTGMPYEHVTCLAFGPDTSLWAGTPEGVCRYLNGEWQYYWGPRWLPNNRVNAIAAAPDGSAWVATDGGVAHLYDRKTTLEQKAAHYQALTDARHNRYGFVTGSRLKKPGDVSGGVVYEASDNDGLWTAVYVAAESFRWAATKDKAAKETAQKSMRAMLDLVRLSGYPGFPARAIIRKGEEVDGYDPNETVRIDGEPDKIWYQSPVDPQVLCKGDTSSDELDGHYFAWSVYYDLVADETDRAAIRSTVRAVTDNLLDHDLTLVGHTGRKTRWGIYSPQYLNDDPYWWEERGLNSLSMLSYLKIAQHICGDQRFKDKYRELIEKHHYLLNTVNLKVAEPWYFVNHSDDEMAFMMYYSLLQLEKDPSTRLVLLQSLERSWRIEQPEASPFFNFVYASATGKSAEVEASATTLRDWPWELVEWESRGRHRHDVTVLTRNGEARARQQLTRVLPASERRLMKWNGNPYECDGGSPDGRTEEDGSAWLLPYWMGRYHRFIAEVS